MASSKLMPSTASTSSLKSDHRRNPINRSESNPKPELYLFQSHESVLIDAENDLAPGSMVSLDGLFRNTTVGRAGEINSGGGAVGRESYFLNSEITLLDAAGAITPITDAGLKSDVPAPLRRKTAEDVWREIVAGGQSEEEGKVECKEEVMDEVMTLEDFLVKAGAVDEAELMADMDGQVKLEPGLSGEMFSFESPYMSRQGSLESVGMMGYGDGTVGNVGGRKRRGANVFEPLDKATQQRQKRMIKNRESAARSRERKQAYQNELESMAVRLEEENEQLLKEKAERTRARHKMLMENIIPVEEKRRPAPAPAPAPARSLRRVRSMLW